ncbi:hypothetical protein [Cohnella sp. GCM10027633]|uniref:hypothetical protein n=1 Tax=unclassified Cohnella TaxID=2636738 RepID=UPI003638141B
METLFRLMLTRAPVLQSDEAPSIRLAQNSLLQAQLGQAQAQSEPRPALKAAAKRFVASAEFVGAPDKLDVEEKLRLLGDKLTELEKEESVPAGMLANAIKEAFGEEAEIVAQDKPALEAIGRLRDSIVSIKLLPEEHRRPVEALANRLRDWEVLLRAVAGGDFPGSGAALRRYRRRSIQLPTEVELRSSLSAMDRQRELEQARKESESNRRKDAETKLESYKRLQRAVEELTGLGGEHLLETEAAEDEGYLVPEELRAGNVWLNELAKYRNLEYTGMKEKEALALKRLEKAAFDGLQLQLEESALKNDLAGLSFKYLGLVQSGSPARRLLERNPIAFRLKAEAEKTLSKSTTELLREHGLSLSETRLDRIVDRLRAELTSIGGDLDRLYGGQVQMSFKRMGGAMVAIKTPLPSVWSDIAIGGSFYLPPIVFPIPDVRVPRTHGSVAPAGVADLLVVKQQLVRYEGADIAHIENVLKGEKKEREHVRRTETEQLTFRESEVSTTEERELETADRFEMSRETSETIKEEASLKAGLSISGSYGPVVEFSVSAEGSLSRSKEESIKTAAKFSQEVTQKSAHKITERILERSSLRVTNEVVETNRHTLDGGDANTAGVYQWVNKVYQAQMFNYGMRTMFDFMVPEPGAFLIEAMRGSHAHATEIDKPIAFALKPDQITESNYHSWVHRYGATDVQPPPDIYVTKSLDFKAGGGDSNTNYNHSGQLQIDEGYKAIQGSAAVVYNIWDQSHSIDLALGNRTHRFNKDTSWVWTTSLDDERGTVPFAADSFKVAQLAVAVEVKCQRTDRAMLKWKLDTHAKLTQAYKARQSEYEEKLAQLEMQAGIAIKGKNPELNLQLIRDELKKNCISIMTEQHFELFGAIDYDAEGMPRIDLYENEAEGPYVRFFEQAFEWEHMTWVTYPYFWGRKSAWGERIAFEDTDKPFNDFIKAGYCRIAVPARPGFEGAIDHFMTYGEIWNGGPLPPISGPLYLPIADELAERLDRPGAEYPEGEPWTVRIPTNLVRLRADDKLPRWEQDESGEWTEV